MPGRYIRLHKGSIVVQQHDLQSVIAHMRDLTRHLEGLIPTEEYMEALFRSREFSGGFAQRQQYERELDRAVLESLATRQDHGRYEPLTVEGYSAAQVESAVYRLWKTGLVDAHTTRPKQITPSTLTTKGYQALGKLTTKAETVGA